MARQIRYFLTMGSPWAYLGHALLMEIAARYGATVEVRPTPLGRLFPQTGGLPLPQRHPARQAYRLVELQRWRARRGVPLRTRPAHSRFNTDLLDRTVIAMVASGANPDPFMRAAFAGIWTGEQDLANPQTVAGLAKETGHDAGALIRLAGEEPVGALYEQNLADALATGVFGAPSYVLDGEIFWGQDRLELLGEALESGRPPIRPDE